MKKIFVVFVVIAMFIAAGVAGYSFARLELKASNTLLNKIALIKPGMNLSSVTNNLGQRMHEITDADYMTSLGSVQDPAFCQGKKMFWFYASTPPCRTLEVYTDTNNVVVYVTWHPL